ncbi:imm11 family protein [Bacterioplanoides pacificum]|uniref:Imm11 family protein n=1 Tax=Bacterioplanoides pacificum TaxID=1171596 RepID=A0ABV7VQJ3_9GAMM
MTNYSNYDEEYYLLYSDENSIMVDLDEDLLPDDITGGIFSNPGEIIQDGYVYPLILDKPYKNDEIADFHELPRTFSYRVIKDVALRHTMPGVQWMPAYIHYKGKRYNDHVIMHLFNEISCMDEEKSVFKRVSEFTTIIDKIVLSKEKLDNIPLEDRLIFRLEEKVSLIFMHQIIVDEIMQHNPVGVRFIKSKDWGVSEAFG